MLLQITKRRYILGYFVVSNIRRVGTSASIRFEAASISFALHATFPGSGSKVDRFDPHTVGGLKSIQVDSMNVVGGVR